MRIRRHVVDDCAHLIKMSMDFHLFACHIGSTKIFLRYRFCNNNFELSFQRFGDVTINYLMRKHCKHGRISPINTGLEEIVRAGPYTGDFIDPGAEYSHEGGFCTFDYIVKKHRLTDPALNRIAKIVRGADTDSFKLAPEAAGLWAISAGLSYNYKDDREQLAIGMKIYDALYSWAKYVQDEKHTWQPKL